jgi:tRNA modification GTPase
LVDEVALRIGNQADASTIVTNERQRECLSRAAHFLDAAIQGLTEDRAEELVSIDIRSALAALEEIVGKTYTEDILGRIFAKFCIGK